jgi:hypothetical protein
MLTKIVRIQGEDDDETRSRRRRITLLKASHDEPCRAKKTEHCNTLHANTSSNLYHLTAATSVKKPGITTICRGAAQSEESLHNRKNIPLCRPLP